MKIPPYCPNGPNGGLSLGEICTYCGEPIEFDVLEGEDDELIICEPFRVLESHVEGGRHDGTTTAGCMHEECFMRVIIGSESHLLRTNCLRRWCDGKCAPDDPDLTKRQAAKRAFEYWERNRSEHDLDAPQT